LNLLRPAFMPDTFHEVNGVAHTSRQFEAFARRSQIPFLSIHCGPSTEVMEDGKVTISQLKRGPARIALDANLDYDLLLMRYSRRVIQQVRQFGADLIHITGPGDMGMLGCYVAWRLKLPLVISWHTSLHEYAGRRLERVLRFLGSRLSRRLGMAAEKLTLGILAWFYRKARVVLAPNQELVAMMQRITGRPTYLMPRGIETDLFTPARRTRNGGPFHIGYAGRLTTEKNVRFLAELGKGLVAAGHRDFEFVILGQGSEEAWLRENVPHALLPGVLRGAELSDAYSNMDVFAFPSTTDTFGNVVLEALASGVPAVVTNSGGPKFLIQPGVTGYIAQSDSEFISAVARLMNDRDLHSSMRLAARQYACGVSWDSVFRGVFQAYEECREPVSDALLSSRVHERGRPRWQENQPGNIR
jgi:phosphatidylinositol alpha 1,6-mannosyltransferase